MLGVSGIWALRVTQAETALRERVERWNHDAAFPFLVEFQDITSGGFPFYYTLHIHDPKVYLKKDKELLADVEGVLQVSSRLMSHAVTISTEADVKGAYYVWEGDKKIVAYLVKKPWSLQGYLREFTSLELLNPSMESLFKPFSMMHRLQEVSLSTGSGLLMFNIEGKETDFCLQPAKLRVGIEKWEEKIKEGWIKIEHIGLSRECHPPLPLVQEKIDVRKAAFLLVYPPLLDLGLSTLQLQGAWSVQEGLSTLLVQEMKIETPLQKQRLAGNLEWHQELRQDLVYISLAGKGEFLRGYSRFMQRLREYFQQNPHLLEAKTEKENELKHLFLQKPSLFKEAIPPLHELDPYQMHLALHLIREEQKPWRFSLDDLSFRFHSFEGSVDSEWTVKLKGIEVLQLFSKPIKKWLEIEELLHSSHIKESLDGWKDQGEITIERSKE